jgi:glycosyltransferase involved in cell wall biosynthesis
MMIETDGPGGAEIMLLQLSEELRRRGHVIYPIGPAKGKGWLSGKLQAQSFDRKTFSLRRPLDWKMLRDMTRMLRELRVDVVHSHEFTMGVYGCAAARLTQIRHVITMHGDQGVTAAWRRRAALRWAFRNSAATVSVSEATARSMELKLGLRPRAMQVIRNGIRHRPGERERFRREIRIGDAEILILAVGSLRPNKGHRLLVDALAKLADDTELPAFRLAIAGVGSEQEGIERLAQEKGLGGRLSLLGQREDIPDLLAAADVFAMPSYSEGLPVALLEAMFASKAIVASSVGGIPGAVKSEREALLTPPGDASAIAEALRRLLLDPGQRTRLGAAAHREAESTFGIELMADAYEALYHS